MIDKSIRQHYQTGEKVKKFGYDVGQKLISPYVDEGGKLDVGKVAKTALTRKLTTAATKKLAGTGILSSLGPIGMLIAYMLAKKGMKYASGKMPDIKTSLQAFQTGFGSPEEQRELRQLENRRQDMLQRKDEGRNYSEKNLDMVTRAIAEAKGLDINNPNEMKNIDKDISNLYSKTITPKVIPETPEVKIPHLDNIITPKKISPISYEDDFATTTIKDILDKKTSEDIITPPPKPKPYSPPARPHGNGGGRNGGGGKGSSPSDAPGSPFNRGGLAALWQR